MKQKIYKWAKSFVTNYEEKKEEAQRLEKKAEEKRREEYRSFSNIVKIFRNSYLDNKAAEFKKLRKPMFSIDEVIMFNWYGGGDSWNGDIMSYLSHTPFMGPTEVIVTDVVVDYGQLGEFIDHLHENDQFTDKYTKNDLNYEMFKVIVNNAIYKHLGKYDMFFGITWSYKVKHPTDTKDYWQYAIAEKMFMRSTSERAVLSTQIFDLELQINKVENQKNDLKSKKYVLIQKLADAKWS